MQMMTDSQLETHRIQGDILLALENGTEVEKESLRRVIEQIGGQDSRDRWDEVVDDLKNE